MRVTARLYFKSAYTMPTYLLSIIRNKPHLFSYQSSCTLLLYRCHQLNVLYFPFSETTPTIQRLAAWPPLRAGVERIELVGVPSRSANAPPGHWSRLSSGDLPPAEAGACWRRRWRQHSYLRDFLTRSTFKCLHIIGYVVKGLLVHSKDCKLGFVDWRII